MQMSKFFHGLHNLANDIVAFMLCLALFFGIASEAFACPSRRPCGQICVYSAAAGTCVLRLAPLFSPSSPVDDEDPTDTLTSPNSDPLPPSSGAVAPPIGNTAP